MKSNKKIFWDKFLNRYLFFFLNFTLLKIISILISDDKIDWEYVWIMESIYSIVAFFLAKAKWCTALFKR